MLRHFVANNGRLVSRSDLLTALEGQSWSIGDRHVDFLINQLRRKLKDSPRAPRFIRTQYGEGYVWVAPRAEGGSAPSGAFLRIGPVRGLERGGAAARTYIAELREELQAGLGAEKSVTIDENPQGAAQDFAIEVIVHRHQDVLHAALLLRHAGELIGVKRIDRHMDSDDAGAATVLQAIWSYLAMPPPSGSLPTDPPPWIRQHDAALLLSGNRDKISWRDNAAMLESAIRENPEDQRLRIMWALNLYARLLQSMSEPDQWLIQKEWREIENEIERICLSVLPTLDKTPEHGLAVAKLLLFVDNRHTALAERLVSDALQDGSAFATAAALRGEIAAVDGRIAEACRLYDEAIDLSEAGSEFYVYLMLMKAAALRAGERHTDLTELAEGLRETVPLAHNRLALLLYPDIPADPSRWTFTQSEMTSSVAAHILQLLFNVFGRRFKNRAHRKNIMDGPIAAFTLAFGDGVVSREIRDGLADPPR